MRTKADMKGVLDKLEHEGVITRTAFDGTYVSVRREEVEDWLNQGFNNDKVSDWFSGRWMLFNECSIVSRNAEGEGFEVKRPDRVMISEDGSRVVVVDFKFGHEKEEYHIQVQNYMNLLAQMYPDSKIEGYLWFVYQGKIKPVASDTRNQITSRQLTLNF